MVWLSLQASPGGLSIAGPVTSNEHFNTGDGLVGINSSVAPDTNPHVECNSAERRGLRRLGADNGGNTRFADQREPDCLGRSRRQ